MTVVQLQDCRVVDGYVVPTNVHMQRLSYETIAFFSLQLKFSIS